MTMRDSALYRQSQCEREAAKSAKEDAKKKAEIRVLFRILRV
jgi:hypothetical protein